MPKKSGGTQEGLINWVGKVGFTACTKRLGNDSSISDPDKVCGWLKAKARERGVLAPEHMTLEPGGADVNLTKEGNGDLLLSGLLTKGFKTVAAILSDDQVYDTLPPIEVLRVGPCPQMERFGLDPVPAEFLKQLADDYDPKILEAPVTKDHEQSGPAFGWIDRLMFDGKRLIAYLKQVPKNFVEQVKAGAYKKRSVEINMKFHVTGRPYLNGVSFLGAAKPAMVGMEDPQWSAGGELLAFLTEKKEQILTFPGENCIELMEHMIYQVPLDEIDLQKAMDAYAPENFLNDAFGLFQMAYWRVMNDPDATPGEKLLYISDLTDQFTGLVREAENQLGGGFEGSETKREVKMQVKDPEKKPDPPATPENAALVEKLRAELEVKLRAEMSAQYEGRIGQLEQQRKLTEINAFLTDLQAEGKVTPAERNAGLDAFLVALPQVEIQLNGKPTTMVAFFKEYLRMRQPVIIGGPLDLGVPPGDVALVLPRGVKAAEVDVESAQLYALAREIELKEKVLFDKAVMLAQQRKPELRRRGFADRKVVA